MILYHICGQNGNIQNGGQDTMNSGTALSV